MPTGLLPLDVVAGDLNSDGSLDLVSANARGPDVSVLLGRGEGSFSAAPGAPLAITAPAWAKNAKKSQ